MSPGSPKAPSPPAVEVGRPTGRRCSCCNQGPLLVNGRGAKLCGRCDLNPAPTPYVWPQWPKDRP